MGNSLQLLLETIEQRSDMVAIGFEQVTATIWMAACDKELQIAQVRSKRVVNKDTAGNGSDLKPA